MTKYNIIAKTTGKFGVQHEGSIEVHGDWDTFGEAAIAVGYASLANHRPESTGATFVGMVDVDGEQFTHFTGVSL